MFKKVSKKHFSNLEVIIKFKKWLLVFGVRKISQLYAAKYFK